MGVKFSQIDLAFTFVSSSDYGSNTALLSLDTGAIYWISDDHESDELPNDFETSDRYIEIPHAKNDLDLGQGLVHQFVKSVAPSLAGEVSKIFSRRGAYGHFKTLLEKHNLLDRWHKYEDECNRDALNNWCEKNNVVLLPETEG